MAQKLEFAFSEIKRHVAFGNHNNQLGTCKQIIEQLDQLSKNTSKQQVKIRNSFDF